MSGNAIESWVNQLQGHIDACENCQPYDEGEVVWISGDSQSVAEFLYENNVPEELHKLVADELACGQCASQLQLDIEIVVDSYESQLDEEGGDRFGWWVVEDSPRLNEFKAHLQQSPDMGREHEVGEELFNQLRELSASIVSGDWWRTRSFPKSAGVPSPSELGPPPKPSETRGRFSPEGLRVFYLASTQSAAIKEARKYQSPGQCIWVQGFRIAGLDGVVNLSPPLAPSDLFRQIRIPIMFAGLMWCNGFVQQREGSQQKVEYLLPQYIADCATELGIRGVMFNSLLHDAKNLVLFSWGDEDVSAVGSPERTKGGQHGA